MGWKKDEDGKLIADGSGNPIRVDSNGNEQGIDENYIGTLNNEAMTRRQELNDMKAKLSAFDGIDAGEAIKAIETTKNIDLSKLVDAGKLEDVRSEVAGQYADKVSGLEAQLIASQGDIHKLLVSNGFASSKFITDKTILPPDVAEAYFGSNFKVEDGKAVAMLNGNPVLSMINPGQLAGMEEALEIMVNSYPNKDSILRGNGASGSGSQGGGNGSIKKFAEYTPAELANINRTDPAKYQQIRQTRE